MLLKAVLFDMDGVIVDTEPLHKKAYFEMFSEFGLDVSEELYATFLGLSTHKIAVLLVEHFGINESPDALTTSKRKFFKHLFHNDPDFGLIPGVEELIKFYHKNGIKLVVASSASLPTINLVLDRFNLQQYFLGKISGADLKESKPDPEIFVRAAEIAEEPHENCMVIEDSTNGILAAHRAGIACTAFKSMHSLKQDYTLAGRVVESFSELQKI